MRLKYVLYGLGAVVLVGLVAVVVVIGPRNLIGMARYDTRREGSLKVGDKVPDVELVRTDGTRVHLLQQLGPKPTVLVFGSFT
jgi:hypothetical protein